MKRYKVVIEPTATGYSAYVPDLPGCVATGKTREEVEREIQEAIVFHLEGMARMRGSGSSEPRTFVSLCRNSRAFDFPCRCASLVKMVDQ